MAKRVDKVEVPESGKNGSVTESEPAPPKPPSDEVDKFSASPILYHNSLPERRDDYRNLVDADPSVFDNLATISPKMQELLRELKLYAGHDVKVLLTGETGTGKSHLARLIHNASTRSRNHFLEINCAAIVETLFESELFGHEKGAFTGAEHKRIGKAEIADGGTLFLDEIGELALEGQAKILTLIQDGTFSRVGGNGQITTDVRFIFATNRDLV